MRVIKKLGHRQEFDLNKIKIALQKTAKSIGKKFSNSDWKELKPRILSRLEPIMKGRDEIYFWEIDDVVIDSLLCSRFKDIAREYIETRSRIKKDHLNDLGLSPISMWLLKERYLRKDDSGKPIETAKEMMCRVATEIASAEKTRELRDFYTKEFSRMLCNLEFLPNSPALVSAGTNRRGTYAACFAFNIEDSLDSIFSVLKDTARTFQLGGGVGINVSNLREKGCKIRTSNGESSGPIAFLHLFDTMVETVKAGGFRRGALMAMMRYDHPDIVDFIHSKRNTDKLNNMNISVLVDDNFFESIKKNEEIELISPRSKKCVRKISANLLLEMIATNIWETGEPGILFYNRMEKDNPTPHLGKLDIVNPCLTGDTWVLTDEGPYQIKDIIGKPLRLCCEGKLYQSNGFRKTGRKEIFRIETNKGFAIKATSNHLFMKCIKNYRNKQEFDWVPLSRLKIGDFIKLSDNKHFEWKGKGTFQEGYILGLLVSDGYIDKSRKRANLNLWSKDVGSESIRDYINDTIKIFKTRKDFKGFRYYKNTMNLGCRYLYELAEEFGISPEKDLGEELEKTSSDFHRGFLCGMFDGDGTVLVNKGKGNSIRLGQVNLDRLFVIQRMLSRLGIDSTIYQNRRPAGKCQMPDGHGGSKLYNRKTLHELVISRENLKRFADIIGFKHRKKQEKMMKMLDSYSRDMYKDNHLAKITSIEKIGIEDVYDTEVEDVHSFDANGILVHNCSESNLLDHESCNLGSINLLKHIKDGEIDWDKLARTTKLAIRFLDNMIDVSPYPTKEIEKAVKLTRKVGLGVMGFADMLILLGIKYSSPEAVEMAGKVMSFINDVANQASIELGKEKGLYEAYRDGYRKRRNAIVTTQAPTGSLSLIAGVSSGIEPNFAREYSRNIGDEVVIIKNPLSKLEAFETTYEIPMEQHLLILAEFQKYVENSISKTINCPEETTVDEIRNLILKAHKLGVKGLTIFRQNCKRESLIKCEDCKI